jgi:hypothetical protein
MRLYRAAPLIVIAACAIGTTALAQTAPTPARKPTTFTIEGEVAPQWATLTPFDYGQVTDSTLVSVTLTAKPRISDRFKLAIKAGPKATLDDDNDNPGGADSAFGLSGKITVPAVLGIALVGSAGYEKQFKNFFKQSKGSKRTYSTGLEYGYNIKWVDKMKLSASALYGITDLTDDSGDHDFAQLTSAFETPLWWFAAFNLEGTGTRRWFDRINADSGFKERRTEWGVSVGLNFAPAIVKLTHGDPDNPWLRKFKAGYNYFNRSSNVPGADKTSSSPSLSFSMGHDF